MWNTLISQTIIASFCKATILNDQFQSVFTDANSTPTVTLEENTFPQIPPINITADGVLQLLIRSTQRIWPRWNAIQGNFCQHSPLFNTHISSFITIMVELTGEGRACIPVGLTKTWNGLVIWTKCVWKVEERRKNLDLHQGELPSDWKDSSVQEGSTH